VQQTVFQPIDPSASLFSPAPELRAPERVNHAGAHAQAYRDDPSEVIIAGSEPISERFCGAQAASALLAFGAAPLLAHAAAVSSQGFVLAGLSSVVAAIAIQISERRRVVVQLTQVALARGVDRETARGQARATLELWLS
jgi:hypothetical protein